ncbi:MAG: dihydroorotase [Spirochaetia bacterium]|nr:dihydroorotase [Spirochaetia bacterium]
MEKEITIRKPSDMHLHLRQGDMLKTTVRDESAWFAQGVVMPNIVPAINTPDRLVAYRDEILSLDSGVKPIMSFKLYKGMSASAVKALAEAGAVLGKLYPAGVTTNSEDGVKSWLDIKKALGAMSDLNLVLSIHCETPDAFVLDREYDYHQEFTAIAKAYPDLRMVFEHISDRRSIDFVAGLPDRVAGTITAHHLLLTLDDVIGANMNPHTFCKPVVKGPKDREALRQAAFSGSSRFFFGSDSAPHLKAKKESGAAAGGIYSSPCAVPLMAELFEEHGQLDKLENFMSVYGPKFYGLKPAKEKLVLIKKESTIPAVIDGIVPLCAGKNVSWSIKA